MTSPEEPDLDALSDHVASGDEVDWDAAESGAAGTRERSQVGALRGIERIAEYHRDLQRSRTGGRTGSDPPPDGARSRWTAPETWGDLTVLELASSGANGEVWRAWDTWLQRDVALKFLQAVKGSDPEGSGESPLLDEARALARVRHPGVVAVHGIGEHDGRVGMWMEFLTGHTLAAEIERRGALPPPEVARIGLALCHALEAVEAAGVVHRDIKPANIVLEPKGRVVLTDFGLGRRWELADPESWRASGTPLFMSPGLLAGQPATPRSDVYALGVTLRWALTGRPPFQARSLDELKTEAATGPGTRLSDERPDAPAALVAVIDRAMAPSPEERYSGAAQMVEALEPIVRGGRRAGARMTLLAIGAIALLAAGVMWWRLGLVGPRVDPVSAQFTVAAPPGTVLGRDPVDSAISPDGRLLAFVAFDSSGMRRLWVRPLQSLEARPLPGTEKADLPFWSPDSRRLGFFSDGKMRKISVAGGSPEDLCVVRDPRGAAWGKGGVIVFVPQPTGSMLRISSEGGDVTEIETPDTTRGETGLRWPEFLPDGRHFLYVALPGQGGQFDVYIGSIDSNERRRVFTSEAAPVCAGDHDLIVVRNGRLMDQRFDFRSLRPVGRPLPLADATSRDVSIGERLASASMNGVLVQAPENLASTRLMWLDRGGHERGVLAVPEGRYEKMFFSPDGRRLLAFRRASPGAMDLWMLTVETAQATRFSLGTQTRIGGRPVWSADGRWVAFTSNRAGPNNIYRRSTTGVADEELLYGSGGLFKEAFSWSPDGRFLVFEQSDPVTGWDLWLLPLTGERKPIAYARSRNTEVAASISPDGHWMAYSSDATGRLEVYVRSFPVPGPEIRVSRDGGVDSYWSSSGKELFVISPGMNNLVWSVPITLAPTFHAGTPHVLFEHSPDALWLIPTPAGDRFLESAPAPGAQPSGLSVQVNWPAMIER